MILAFTLSMPNANSWNGKWSGSTKYYARTHNFGKSKKGEEQAKSILAKKYYHYNFGDGWAAGVSVKEVDSKSAAKIRKNSAGFCGYDWMINSIIDFGEILNATQEGLKPWIQKRSNTI